MAVYLEQNCRPLWCAPDDIDARVLLSDTTRKDIQNGRKPRYSIWFRNEHFQTELVTTADGIFLFEPDEKLANAALEDERRVRTARLREVWQRL